jgi:hypothetical protein
MENLAMVIVLGCFHLILVTVAAVFIYLSKTSGRAKKVLQLIFSILIPIAGPVITVAIHISDHLTPLRPDGRQMGQSIDESPAKDYIHHT